MHDALRLDPGKQRRHGFAIGNVFPVDVESLVRRELRQPIFLQLHVVIIVDVVDGMDFIAAFQQIPADMKADKARRSGQQDFHRR